MIFFKMESLNVYCKDPSLKMQIIWPKNEKKSALSHLSFTHFLGDSTHTKNQILSTQSVTILSTKNVLSRHLLTNTTTTTKLVGISYLSEEPSHCQISFDVISLEFYWKTYCLAKAIGWRSISCIENSGHIEPKATYFMLARKELLISSRSLSDHYSAIMVINRKKVQLWILHPNGLVERQKTKQKGSISTSFK